MGKQPAVASGRHAQRGGVTPGTPAVAGIRGREDVQLRAFQGQAFQVRRFALAVISGGQAFQGQAVEGGKVCSGEASKRTKGHARSKRHAGDQGESMRNGRRRCMCGHICEGMTPKEEECGLRGEPHQGPTAQGGVARSSVARSSCALQAGCFPSAFWLSAQVHCLALSKAQGGATAHSLSCSAANTSSQLKASCCPKPPKPHKRQHKPQKRAPTTAQEQAPAWRRRQNAARCRVAG